MNLNDIYDELKTKEIDTRIPFEHPIKTKNKSLMMSIGRIWFNLLLPDNFRLVDEQINQSKIKSIINELYELYPVEELSSCVELINKESFKLSTIIPQTFDIDSLVIPSHIDEERKKLIIPGISPDDLLKIRTRLAMEYLEYIKKTNKSGIYDLLLSGARGDPNEWAMLMISKGFTVDVEGKQNKPILSSLDDGMNLEEYYNSAKEGRFTSYVKSHGTAEPGYLNSKLAFANANILIQEGDCGTDRFLNLKVTNRIIKLLNNRYIINESNEIELVKNFENFMNKTIKLRSPIYCINPNGICEICYGKLFEVLNTKKIGLLTAAVFNQFGVTLTMKLKHKSSMSNVTLIDFTKDILI